MQVGEDRIFFQLFNVSQRLFPRWFGILGFGAAAWHDLPKFGLDFLFAEACNLKIFPDDVPLVIFSGSFYGGVPRLLDRTRRRLKNKPTLFGAGNPVEDCDSFGAEGYIAKSIPVFCFAAVDAANTCDAFLRIHIPPNQRRNLRLSCSGFKRKFNDRAQ